jgi:putative membrane protein
MLNRAKRFIPAVAAAGVAALGTGTYAVANDHHPNHGDRDRQSGGHHRCDQGRYSAWDEQWLMSSIEGDRFEIRGGHTAEDKGQDPKIRALGSRLVSDHTKSLHDAVELARKLGIDVPDSPSPSQQWELKTVAKFTGNTFDRAYADLEVLDHQQDIQESKDEVSDGCNREVRKQAAEDIPVLQQHLQLSQQAQQAVGSW